MAHQHLHFQEDVAAEGAQGKQWKVSLALLGTLLGGVLLINGVVGRLFYPADSFNLQIFMMLGALLLGTPIVVHAIASLIRGESHMDELAALGIVAAFSTGEYVAAGLIGFFMLLSELVETRLIVVNLLTPTFLDMLCRAVALSNRITPWRTVMVRIG
jgi:Zn2+/Cd2+-exporting ATPase